MNYLNALHDKYKPGSDGYIESLVTGPDILFGYKNIPNHGLKMQYVKVRLH